MGLRGPAPKPTALKVLAGNPGKRPLNAAEPKPDRALPKCPAWLRKEAKAEWKRIAGKLHKAGVLTSVDGSALAVYCQTWARWVEAEREVERLSQVTTSAKGSLYMSPWLTAAMAAGKAVADLAAQFGMTPSSRSRITAQADDDGAEKTLAELLFEDKA